MFEPSLIGPDWFKNDDTKTSLGCGPADDPDDGGDNERLTPDTTQILGLCYPLELDLDGDGMCDGSDTDPNDPCVPNGVDSDGDGICDGLDPDPLDSCIPLKNDTDNDGICDILDPDPNEPCVPNGVDSDNDGICDTYDPDPVNPDPLNTVSYNDCWWLTDIHGDHLWSIGYKSNHLAYSIQDLEWLAIHFTGSEMGGYESLHYVESMTFLFEVLHTSPYYRMLSNILNDKYNEMCENYSSIASFVKIAHDIRALDKLSNQEEISWLKKQVYLNKLSFLETKLNPNDPVDSIHLIHVNEIINVVRTEMEAILEVHNNTRENNIIQLSAEINNLPEDFPVYNALKDYYAIYDQHILRNIALTNSQIITLTEMSKLCPLIFGEAVHHSRAMLVGAEINEFSDFDDSCLITTWNTKKESISSNDDVVVSPNPSMDWLKITAKEVMEKIDVLNTQGKSVLTKILDTNEVMLNIIELPSCVYYLRIVTEDGKTIVKKIVKF